MKYLVLLRGVNVGGHSRVVMKELAEKLKNAGFDQVKTYINSGNLFLASGLSSIEVKQRLDQLLHQAYDFEIPTLVLSAAEYQQDFDHQPNWWGEDPLLRHNALFLLPNFDLEAFQTLTTKVTLYDHIKLGQRVIFWTSTFKKDYSKSVYAKLARTPLYKEVTIRNRNTALKLGTFLQE
ncbi:DUF1697 domain-containing protein [Pediococcus siamensis]|uniref:DUF1697 domain-containing protein n=1 Tax=Pediococcus siamensis TaxID=381829 RepID=UPI00399F4010